MAVCQVCGAEVGDDDSIVLLDRRVCRACKPLIVEQLKQGGVPAALVGEETLELDDHEFGYRELIEETWSICRKDWLAMVGLHLVGAIPLVIRGLLHLLKSSANIHPAPSTGGVFLMTLLSFLLGALPMVGVAWVVSERAAGRSLSFVGALVKAVRRWMPVVWTNFHIGIGVAFLSLLLIVPGIIFLFYWIFGTYAVALRHWPVGRALDYSKILVKGRWWRVAGKSLLLTIPSLIPVIASVAVTEFLPRAYWMVFSCNLGADLMSIFYEVGVALMFLNLDALQRRPPLA